MQKLIIFLVSLSLVFGQAWSEPVKSFSAADYEHVAELGIGALLRKDTQAFVQLLSPTLIARTTKSFGKEAVADIVESSFQKFFEDVKTIEPSTTETSANDADGHKGMAYFKAARTTQGLQKPFAIYVLEEGGRLVIGNVIVDKTMREIQSALSGKK